MPRSTHVWYTGYIFGSSIATCGKVPAGKTEVARIPYSSYSCRMACTLPEDVVGSVIAPDGTNRSGCRLSACLEVASDTPIRALVMLKRSISCRVTATGSEVGRAVGTFLNMYSAGNCISSSEPLSRVCRRMKSYCSNPSCGKPIIVSNTGRPAGIGMRDPLSSILESNFI